MTKKERRTFTYEFFKKRGCNFGFPNIGLFLTSSSIHRQHISIKVKDSHKMHPLEIYPVIIEITHFTIYLQGSNKTGTEHYEASQVQR
ncbi:hypothetical protein [Peribacillus muralis]|uniref:hypothetical protein n=1 Tax=Peribacillus muralis TaxID=264697 RepID=UPI003D056D41